MLYDTYKNTKNTKIIYYFNITKICNLSFNLKLIIFNSIKHSLRIKIKKIPYNSKILYIYKN